MYALLLLAIPVCGRIVSLASRQFSSCAASCSSQSDIVAINNFNNCADSDTACICTTAAALSTACLYCGLTAQAITSSGFARQCPASSDGGSSSNSSATASSIPYPGIGPHLYSATLNSSASTLSTASTAVPSFHPVAPVPSSSTPISPPKSSAQTAPGTVAPSSSSLTSNTTSSASQHTSSTPIGAIVGGFVGGLGALSLLGMLILFLLWRNKRKALNMSGGQAGANKEEKMVDMTPDERLTDLSRARKP